MKHRTRRTLPLITAFAPALALTACGNSGDPQTITLQSPDSTLAASPYTDTLAELSDRTLYLYDKAGLTLLNTP